MPTDLDGMFWQHMTPEEAEAIIGEFGDRITELETALKKIVDDGAAVMVQGQCTYCDAILTAREALAT